MRPLTDDELLARAVEADNEFKHRTALAFRELVAARKVIEEARNHTSDLTEYEQRYAQGLIGALYDYDEATR